MSVRTVVAAILVCVAAFGAAADASACGGFFSRTALEAERRPSLSYEQALILYDAASRRQHFIREVAFRASAEPFGFVVPTPGRPEVSTVDKSPFAALRTRFPFERKSLGFGRGGGVPRGGIGSSGSGYGVKVLEQKRVGSFTAFVLAADDETALASWLKKNGLVSTPEADAWLAHYVKMKFFYVALRYEPKGDGAAKLQAETLRISFDSPLPYYPYFEPNPPKGVSPGQPRLLELWYASTSRVDPVALRRDGAGQRWVRPLAEGLVHETARTALTAALGKDASLLPEGELSVQTFVDQKRSRVGFGDVLFLARGKSMLDPAQRKRLEPLLPVLDPGLLAGGSP